MVIVVSTVPVRGARPGQAGEGVNLFRRGESSRLSLCAHFWPTDVMGRWHCDIEFEHCGVPGGARLLEQVVASTTWLGYGEEHLSTGAVVSQKQISSGRHM